MLSRKAVLGFALLFVANLAHAQSTSGTIAGRVTDSTGVFEKPDYSLAPRRHREIEPPTSGRGTASSSARERCCGPPPSRP